ncbi:hypothetical protein PIB30_064990 [Stylosanthes scabra]|uniref:Uncharacterized protein n=1 Tax=Stylosanthes scabra TaxID=79078 RepID=A0ABU6QLE6_9FABA|nr:hypothetical protein [Stylosanthes scabra]
MWHCHECHDNDVSRNLPDLACHDSVNALMLDVKQQMQKVVDSNEKEKLIPRKRANPTTLSKGEADVDTSVDTYGDEPDRGLARKVTKPNVGQPRQTKMDTRAASEISPDEDSSTSSLFRRFKGKYYGYDGRYLQSSKRTDFKLGTSTQAHPLR